MSPSNTATGRGWTSLRAGRDAPFGLRFFSWSISGDWKIVRSASPDGVVSHEARACLTQRLLEATLLPSTGPQPAMLHDRIRPDGVDGTQPQPVRRQAGCEGTSRSCDLGVRLLSPDPLLRGAYAHLPRSAADRRTAGATTSWRTTGGTGLVVGGPGYAPSTDFPLLPRLIGGEHCGDLLSRSDRAHMLHAAPPSHSNRAMTCGYVQPRAVFKTAAIGH
jgi:hypothetical protein